MISLASVAPSFLPRWKFSKVVYIPSTKEKFLFFYFLFFFSVEENSWVFCSYSSSFYFCFSLKIIIILKYENSYIIFPHSTCYIANTIRIPILKCTNLQSNVVIKFKIFSNEELDINFYEELIWIFEISVKNKSFKQVLDTSKFQHYWQLIASE